MFLMISRAENLTFHGGKENSFVNKMYLRLGISVGKIGPGGMGKTKYALEISIRLLSGKLIPKWSKVKKFPKKIKFFTNYPEYETRRRIKGISKSLGVYVPANLILDRPFNFGTIT